MKSICNSTGMCNTSGLRERTASLLRRFAGGILALSLSASVAAVADITDPNLLEAYVDGIVKPLMKTNNSPSGTVAIVRNGALVLAKGYGYEDIDESEPVQADVTLFRPGSVSKLFTWVAVMQQVEQGRLDLDTDVNEYLESFHIEEEFGQPITLWHVLTHTTGFEDGALGYLIIDDPDKALPLREAMAKYQPERVNPPGAQTAYSNYATALAGLIVENVSGVPFNEYITRYILDPLKMYDSTFVEPLPERLADKMAASYAIELGDFVEKPFEIISSFSPAGAMSSTATDMVRFGQAILNGGELESARILEAETVERMLSEQFSHDPRLMGMGLGFYATDYNGYRVMGHGGDTRWFHSYLGIDAENSLVFFVSFGGSGGSTVRTAFAPAFYDQFFPRNEVPPEPPEDFTARGARFAGNYGFWRANFSTIEKAFGLTSVVPVVPTEDGTLMIAFGDKAKQYVEVDDLLFRELNPLITLSGGLAPRQLAFQQNEAGEITGFIMDGLPFMSLRKLPPWATPNFNFTLLGLSVVVFLGVLLRRFYQRTIIRNQAAANRGAVRAAVYASLANVLTLALGGIVLAVVGDELFGGIPTLFRIWLVLPILAIVAGIYLLLRTFVVWKDGLLSSVWARLRYTVVTLCALFMCWFYWYWNILGWQYMST